MVAPWKGNLNLIEYSFIPDNSSVCFWPVSSCQCTHELHQGCPERGPWDKVGPHEVHFGPSNISSKNINQKSTKMFILFQFLRGKMSQSVKAIWDRSSRLHLNCTIQEGLSFIASTTIGFQFWPLQGKENSQIYTVVKRCNNLETMTEQRQRAYTQTKVDV